MRNILLGWEAVSGRFLDFRLICSPADLFLLHADTEPFLRLDCCATAGSRQAATEEITFPREQPLTSLAGRAILPYTHLLSVSRQFTGGELRSRISVGCESGGNGFSWCGGVKVSGCKDRAVAPVRWSEQLSCNQVGRQVETELFPPVSLLCSAPRCSSPLSHNRNGPNFSGMNPVWWWKYLNYFPFKFMFAENFRFRNWNVSTMPILTGACSVLAV